jgi:hypothetical protein
VDAVQEARDRLRSYELFARYDTHHYDVEQLHARLIALDTWHDWAAGRERPLEHLAEALQVLTIAAGDDPTGRCQALGDALSTWARRHLPELVAEPDVEWHLEPRTRAGPELDIGL